MFLPAIRAVIDKASAVALLLKYISFANAQLLNKRNPSLSLFFVLKVKASIFSFRPQVPLDSIANSNVVKSNDRVVCKSVDPDLEMKVCVDESFASATNEVTPQ